MKFQSIRKIVKLNAHQVQLLIEAQGMLLLARIALACLPFRLLASRLNRLVQPDQMAETLRLQHIQEVQWAITACVKSGLCHAVCFPQGIAAMKMLRSRGLAPTLYYGVRNAPGGGLEAHVWVKEGDTPVVGVFQSSQFAIVHHFPQTD